MRDVTGGNRLPLRVFPGAPTDTLRANANSTSSSFLFVDENSSATVVAGAGLDTSTVLSKLAGLNFSTFTLPSDSLNRQHFKPTAASFNTAFGLGNGTGLSPTDVGSVALAGLQQLNAKVDALPQAPDSTTGLAAANAKITALETANTKMLKSLAKLQKQVKKLSKKKK